MENYLSSVLYPAECTPSGIPDEFPRKTAVFKMNGNATITSSATNGHMLLICYPNYFMATGNAFIVSYTDGTSALDVTNLPATANLSSSTINGTTITAYYSYARLVGLELKLTYIGAVETGAGETRSGFTNYATLTAGTNIKNAIEDADFFVADRAECTYKSIWLPQDNSDFKFRTAGDNGEADKSSSWGIMMICSTGLPKNIAVYDLKWTAIVEGMTIPSVADFIPRTITPIGNTTECLMKLKQLVYEDPSRVCGVIKTSRRLAMATDEEMQGGTVPEAIQAAYQNPQLNRFGTPVSYSSITSTIRDIASNPIGYAGSKIGQVGGAVLRTVF